MATANEKAGPMTRADVAGAIAARHGLPQSQADAITREYEAAIMRALTSGQEVRLNGFGVFKLQKRAARMTRNPQNGEMKQQPEKTVPKFQPSKTMKDAVISSNNAKSGGAKSAAKTSAKAATPVIKSATKSAAAKGGKKK